MNWLKGKPLSFQIWIILGFVMSISFIIVAILSSFVLKMVFTAETYSRIEEVQEYFLQHDRVNLDDWENNLPKYKISPTKTDKHPPIFRVVRHIIIYDSGQIKGQNITREIIQEIKARLERNNVDNGHYSIEIKNRKILYVLKKVEIDGKKGYLISYLPGLYRDNLVEKTFFRILGILAFVLLTSWIASIFITRYLTRPLMKLKQQVKEIASRKWDNPVDLDRKDEIGQLGEAIDSMRCQLVEHHQKQQSFLQQISHELKTPVMVIRSYARSILEGVSPVDDLEESLGVIEGETEKLEKRVHSLLNISKLDYLAMETLKKEEFNFTELIKETADKFGWRKTELKWELKYDTKPWKIFADKDKLRIALENIFDNQIRYAKSLVKIKVSSLNQGDNYKIIQGLSKKYCDDCILIQIYNDGPPISKKIMDNLFYRFNKGDDGQFGLGLAIVKTIIDRHNGGIRAVNEKDGVSFYVILPVNT